MTKNSHTVFENTHKYFNHHHHINKMFIKPFKILPKTSVAGTNQKLNYSEWNIGEPCFIIFFEFANWKMQNTDLVLQRGPVADRLMLFDVKGIDK